MFNIYSGYAPQLYYRTTPRTKTPDQNLINPVKPSLKFWTGLCKITLMQSEDWVLTLNYTSPIDRKVVS